MIFKKDLDSGSLEVVKEENATLKEENATFKEENATLKGENTTLKEEKIKNENTEKITRLGKVFGQTEVAQQCVEDGLSYADAVVKVAEGVLAKQEVAEQEFNETASTPANIELEGEDEEVKTWFEAVNLIAKREGIKKEAAARVAANEFPILFKERNNK
jgi:FtsZ-binding cell division protein ZapB